ncbi:MAG: GntR family transcriptional regulator [Verrucomicrobia bacterium]|nr:GntR family transcriptional regulator [Verrucomicrobiota bacterium]
MSQGTTTLRQRAYAHLQRKLISGELRSGSIISEQSLASEIGVSRTPVREAIRTLEQEGVLEQVPRFGTVVRKLDRRDLIELFELREAIEPFAVGQAATRATAADVRTLRDLCQEIAHLIAEVSAAGAAPLDDLQMRRLLTADLSFHLTLLRMSGNGRMVKIVSDSRLLTGIFSSRRQPHTAAVLKTTLEQHEAILRAVELDDRDRASALMLQHIRHSKAQALEAYDLDAGIDRTPSSTEQLLAELNRPPMKRKTKRPPKSA